MLVASPGCELLFYGILYTKLAACQVRFCADFMLDVLRVQSQVREKAMGKTGMLDGVVWCTDHVCPMIRVGDNYECVVERMYAHLGGKRVKDIVPSSGKTPLTLVFEDGHTLPLLCPDCGGVLHVAPEDEEAVLEQAAGLYLIGVAYLKQGEEEPDAPEMLALAFGLDPEADPDDADAVEEELLLHLDSARRLTCLGESRVAPHRRTKKRGRG